MNITLRHTEFLLTAHDCVVITGLGAFLRRRHPAYFAADGTLMPPAYSYAFNPELLVSDGLLENSISRSLSVPHVRAAALIERDVDAMRHQLEHEGRLPIGRIGDLVLEEDSRILFEGRDSDMLTPMALWLPVVPAPETAASVEENETAVMLQPERRHKGMRLLRRIAAVAAVAAVAIMTSTPISVDNASLASTALPSVTAPRTAYVPKGRSASVIVPAKPEESAVTVSPVSDGKSVQPDIKVESSATKPVQKTLADSEVSSASKRQAVHFDSDDEFIVVVASLTNREDAEKFIREARRRYGGQYGISSHDGSSYYRVYAATGVSSRQARAAINNGSLSHFPGAWVTTNP